MKVMGHVNRFCAQGGFESGLKIAEEENSYCLRLLGSNKLSEKNEEVESQEKF